MTEPSVWIALIGLSVTLLGGWVRINSQIAKLDARGVSEKAHCDGQLALMRAEIVAVEARGNAGLEPLRRQLERIDGKVDRLLERHP